MWCRNNHDLSLNNALKLKSVASKYIRVEDVSLLPTILKASEKFLVLGGMTNIILPQYYDGTVVQLINTKIKHIDSKIKHKSPIIKVDSGVVWDDFVQYSLEHNFFGLENLSGIPGGIGASPVQNIGAYGVEISEYIDSVDVYDHWCSKFYTISNQKCLFKYRSSIFKQSNRYIIIAVNFILNLIDKPNTSYKDLQPYHHQVNAKQLRQIIINIRKEKLPDVRLLPNVGSFFQNPIVTIQEYQRLLAVDKNIIGFVNENQVKISAAYLIQSLGLKPFFMYGFSVYHKHALVLVNYNSPRVGNKNQLLVLVEFIQKLVFATYKILLAIEPNIC